MAIAFGRAANHGQDAATTPIAATITINAGETGVLFFLSAFSTGVATVSSVTGGGTWTKRGSSTANQGGHVMEMWATDAGAATAASSVSVAFTGGHSGDDAGLMVLAYTGALAIGNTNIANAATNPETISITTQDPNNFVVAVLTYTDASVADPGGGLGTQRNVIQFVSASDIYMFGKDNTSATATSVTCSKGNFSPAADWVAAAIELRSTNGQAPPPTFLAGDDDSFIPQVELPGYPRISYS